MEDLFGKGYICFIDNYFTSIELLEKLKTENILACGTIRPNRKGLPPLISDKDLNRGDFDYRISDQKICVYKMER